MKSMLLADGMKRITFALVLVMALPAMASAQEPTPAQRTHARELYTQGQSEFAAHHYQQALDAFQGAFREVPNPVVLLGVASAQEQLGQREQSRATLEQYLALRPDAPDRASVQARIDALPAPSTGTVHVACTPAGANIELDGHTIGTGTADTQTTPGAHELRVTLAGHEPVSRAITVAAGQRVDVDLQLVEVAGAASTGDGPSEDDVFGAEGADEPTATTDDPEEPTTTPPPTDPSTGVWVTTAIAGVALVTGTIFGFLALSKQSDFDAMPTSGTANDGETFALVADLSFAVAAVAGITAIVLYATERPSTSTTAASTSSLRVVPLAGPTGGGVALGGTFW